MDMLANEQPSPEHDGVKYSYQTTKPITLGGPMIINDQNDERNSMLARKVKLEDFADRLLKTVCLKPQGQDLDFYWKDTDASRQANNTSGGQPPQVEEVD